MAITLNHTIVPARDKEASARFFAQIFGLKYEGPMSHFAPVRINGELTMDFDNAETFELHHYAFMSATRSSTLSSSACKRRESPGAVIRSVGRIGN